MGADALSGEWQGLLVAASVWTIGWTVLFYVLCGTQSSWMKSFSESSKPHENDKYWCARNVIGIIHAVLICILAVPPLMVYLSAPSVSQYAYSPLVSQCAMETNVHPEFEAYSQYAWMVALGGLAFTTFTISDLAISSIHGLATWDYVCHHLAFISAGLILRTHCMMPFNSAVLMGMEVSTPFLNYMLLIRNRGDKYQMAASVNGVLFFFTFVVSRILLNTYATVQLLLNELPHLFGEQAGLQVAPRSVPAWQMWYLMVALTAGAGVQFFWFPAIFKNFVKGVKGVLRTGQGTMSEDSYTKMDDGYRVRLPSGDIEE